MFGELARRNVFRAGAIYLAAVWALAQGFAQLQPVVGAPEWITLGFLVAAAIGFPFWIAFAWLYAFTPGGLKRESEIAPGESIAHSTGRKLDFAIIGVLAVAVVLLLTDRMVRPLDAVDVPAKSIAVLPFENLGGDKDGEYFVVGIQDEILTRLANIGDLKVVSRTSTEQYRSHAENLREVARQLDVANIVEGSVQRAGDKVRITVQLIDARSDAHLWAQSYDREMHDVFAVQSDVAGQVASALKVTLQPAETQALAQAPTTDPLAYDLFLRAEYLANRGEVNFDVEPLRQSLAPYRQAIARDPAFALALARLSYAQSMLVWLNADGAEALTAQARANAERARELGPKLADAFIALGFTDYYGRDRQDYDAALASFATAQRLRPNDADAMAAAGYVYRRQGRITDSIRKLAQALDHDPRNTRILASQAANYMIMRRYADAEAALRRALALDPDNMRAQILLSSSILSRTGDPARALAVLRGDHPRLELKRVGVLWYQRNYSEAIAILEAIPDSPDLFENSSGYPKAARLGWLYKDLGEAGQARHYYELAEGKARQALADAEAGDSTGDSVFSLIDARHVLAEIELGLGHTEEAVRLTDEAQALVDGLGDDYLAVGSSLVSASIYSRVGRVDLAVSLLDRILAAPNGGFAYAPALLSIDPDLDPIRDDPRFIALLGKYPVPGAATAGDRQRGTAIATQGLPAQ